MGLFDFMSMSGTYEQRKVDNTKINDVEIDTAMVTDCVQPYETGICSKYYNNNNWVIVEQYDTKEEAVIGHKWVNKFKKKLPKTIKDISTCEIAQFIACFVPSTKVKHLTKK